MRDPMSLYYIFCALILYATILQYINYRFIKWPWPIAVMFLSLTLSFILILFSNRFPSFTGLIQKAVRSIDFYDVVIKIFLGFILFSGAFKVDIDQLKKEIKPVLALAIFSTLISTFVVGYLLFFTFQLLKLEIPLIHCFLFGALICPTDPVAVLGIIKRIGVPVSVEMKITGESLFNDAIAIVIFSSLFEAASQHRDIGIAHAATLFMKEVGGGVLWGMLLAFIGFYTLKSIDNYQLEILITLALVMVGYSVADQIEISGPVAVVIAGLVTGSRTRWVSMSDQTQTYVTSFWELLEYFLNLILFLLIGLELLIIPQYWLVYFASGFVIVIILVARFISVAIPVYIFPQWFANMSTILLTWCGLRGGISIALALSLTNELHRPFFLILTYIVVIFSILIQGLTVKKLVRKLKVAE